MNEGLYAIEYLPAALLDLTGIARYVSRQTGSAERAERLSARIVEGIDSLATFPYLKTVYVPLRPLRHEYRALRIDRYLVFYWIRERPRTVTVADVIYERADIGHRLAAREE